MLSALISLTLALVMFSGLVILLLKDGYRLAALGVLAVAFLAAAAGLQRVASLKLQAGSNLFRASLSELDRDQRAALTSHPPP